MCYDGSGRLAAPFNADLHVSAFELKLRDILFYQEIDKLFQLFLVHECIRLFSALITRLLRRARAFSMKLKRDQVLCGRRQDFVSSFGDKNHIFDSDSTVIRNVDAWLNRNDHPRSKLLGLALGQPGLLMHLNSHSVPRGMGKESVKASFFQYFPPGAVHFTGLHAWPYSSNRGQLRFP